MIKIDKRKGKFNLHNSIELDDYAYLVYLNVYKNAKKNNPWLKRYDQITFKTYIECEIKIYGNDIDYYKIATKVLREEKLNKLS